MRVDAYNAISQVYNAKRPNGTKAQKTDAAAGSKDEFQISSFGKDFQIAKQAVADASDVREDKVSEMKAKYSGNYHVPVDDFADALLEKYYAAF